MLDGRTLRPHPYRRAQVPWLTARLGSEETNTQIASSVRRLAFVYEGMKRTPRITGRLGLLATPLMTAALALALSACGSQTPSSAPTSSAPASTPASAGTSAATGSSAPAATSESAGGSAAAFCQIWEEMRTTLSEMNTIFSDIPTSGMSTPASVLLPTMQGINGVFKRLVPVAPAAISADMTTLASFWSQVVADFQYGTTVGQVKAYIHAHPPATAATIGPAVQAIRDYLTTTCHINLSS
jgi:hypothetical protein